VFRKYFCRAALILTCAAVTFAAAQFPWESGSDDNSSSSSWSDSSPSYESSFESSSDQSSPYDSYSSDPSPSFEPASQPEQTKQAPKERAPRQSTTGSAKFSGPQKTCPVCVSIRLKENLYVPHNGKNIHVCSISCISRVKRNPAPFAQKLEKRGEQLGQ